MRLAVLTPVGPGHQSAVKDCCESVVHALRHDRGVFKDTRHVLIDDSKGELGRSKARNLGMTTEADWFMFLDADDLCEPTAFGELDDAVYFNPSLVALFGSVAEEAGTIQDNLYPLDWQKLLKHGPVGTLSMGCFFRADVARAHPFNEELDAGEDFDFYLRALNGQNWKKLDRPLVTIRNTVPSAIGPRGYTSLDWRDVCQEIVNRWKSTAR